MKSLEVKNFNHENIFPLLLANFGELGKVTVGEEIHQTDVYLATSVAAHKMVAKPIMVNDRVIGNLVVSRYLNAPRVVGYIGEPPNWEVPLTHQRKVTREIEGGYAQVTIIPKTIGVFYYHDGLPGNEELHRMEDEWPLPLP